MNPITVFVPGLPVPQGSKRQVPTAKGMRIIEDKDKELKAWRKVVAFHVLAARQRAGSWLDPEDKRNGHVPYKLTIVFVMPHLDGDLHESPPPIPTLPRYRIVKRGKPKRPTRKPDADKMTRAIADAVTKIAWRDDCQMVDISVHKFFGQGVTGAWICIEQVDPMHFPLHLQSALQREGFSIVGVDIVAKGK